MMIEETRKGKSVEGLNARSSKVEITTFDYIRRFEKVLLPLLGWFLFGIMLDSWAHVHFGEDLETFFTPWHGVLYAGFLASSVYMIWFVIKERHFHDNSFIKAIPPGYKITYLGIPLFLLSGTFDMFWHELLGIEASIEAMYSLSHLLGFLTSLMILTGPLRARLTLRSSPRTLKDAFPIIFGSFALMFVITIFTAPFQVFFFSWASNVHAIESASIEYNIGALHFDFSYFIQGMGTAGVLFSSVMLMGVTTFLIVRFPRLPSGTLHAVISGITTVQCILGDQWFLLPVAVLSGMIVELCYHLLLRYVNNPMIMIRILSFVSMFAIISLYFAALLLTVGTTWSLHLILGAPMAAGVTGLLVSYLTVPPHANGSWE